MCSKDGELHGELLRFINGDADLEGLAGLEMMRARMRFVPVVETFAESRHKDINMEGQTRYRVSPSRVSLNYDAMRSSTSLSTSRFPWQIS